MSEARLTARDARFDGMDLAPLLAELWGAQVGDVRVTALAGQASLRRYYRLEACGSARDRGLENEGEQPRRAIVMRLPDSGPGSFVAGAELPFCNVQRHLRAQGVPVPTIYVDHSASTGLVALEDLGDETFEARLLRTPAEDWPGLYTQAVTLLATLHLRTATPDPACVAYGRSFDRALLSYEIEHFREWGLDALVQPLRADERALLDAQFSWLTDAILSLPHAFSHRDYQSRNLMWARPDALVVIDFQDALIAPCIYDLVALLCDSYLALSADLQRHGLTEYARLRGWAVHDVQRAFDLICVQRKLKDAGRFVFLDRVRGNPDFLSAFGPSLAYVDRALARLPELSALRGLLAARFAGYPDHVATPQRIDRALSR